MRITMYPPPPRLPANGNVTASAKPVATAASTALPPAFMISSPAALASALLLATIEVGTVVPCSPVLKRHSAGNVAGRAAESHRPSTPVLPVARSSKPEHVGRIPEAVDEDVRHALRDAATVTAASDAVHAAELMTRMD